MRRGWGSGRRSEKPAASPAGAAGSTPVAESRRLEAALDVIGEGIVICDAAGEVAFRNIAAGRHLGSAPSDALAVQAVLEMGRQALDGRSPERRLDLLSPTRRSLQLRAFPIGKAGAVEGSVVVLEDITERMRLESIRRDFVANVSHELKTPAGALTLLAETIDGEDDPRIVGRLAQRMGTEADRLVRIIDDLLDLSRIEAGETVQKALVPVDELLGDATDRLQSVATRLEVALKVGEIAPGLAIPGERRDLVSAVANLLDNAIKYSEPGGEVLVWARAVQDGVRIHVADKGAGIPARDLERIFERFYRVDRARSRTTGGTGLGLSIVRHVAANHGGTVSVHSKEGEGSTFVLALPAVVPPGGSNPGGTDSEGADAEEADADWAGRGGASGA